MKIIYLSFFALLFSSCTFLKSSEDHQRFLANKLSEIYNQKGILQPNINNGNYEEFSAYKFVDYINPKRTGDGTFLTKMNIYSIAYDYENCQLPVPDRPGYVYTNRWGNRVKSLLKEPLGILEVRTAFDGENIYIINSQITGRFEYDNDRSKWTVLQSLNTTCR